MISKKALSIVVGEPISQTVQGTGQLFYGNGLTTMRSISDTDLAHACKQKANEKGYGILSGYNIKKKAIANIFYGKDNKDFTHIKADTEPVAVIKSFELLVREGYIQ